MRNYRSKSMNRFYIFTALFLFAGGIFSAYTQDRITLKNGGVIEAKVVEVSPVEIKYKNFNHPDGPLIIIPADSVLSIKYENSINNNTITIPITPGGASKDTPVQQSGTPTAIQSILNSLPAISIAGNNLKFEFSGETWTAKVNNENFSAGTITFESTADGGLLTLKQTHIWPGATGKAAAKTAGRIASLIPGGSSVAGALETAGNIAGAVGALAGAVEASGSEMVLEYKAGPSASLKLVSTRNTAQKNASSGGTQTTAMDPDKLIFGITANPIGFLFMGPSICLDFTKGNFNFEVNLIYPVSLEGFDVGFGGLITFNYFWSSRIGGAYLGGGIGCSYYSYYGDAFSFPVGVNGGYKFVTSSGLYFRTGAFVGFDFGLLREDINDSYFYLHNIYGPVYIKPDLAIGWTIGRVPGTTPTYSVYFFLQRYI